MKFLGCALLVLLAALAVLILVLRNLRNEMKLTKAQLAASEKARDEYARQVQRLTNAGEITAEVRKKADEKNAKLHSGDAVDNAIKQLSKSKN